MLQKITDIEAYLIHSLMEKAGFFEEQSRDQEIIVIPDNQILTEKRQGVTLSDCQYAGKTISQGLLSNNTGIYSNKSGNRNIVRALADMYKDAAESETDYERTQHLQLLGNAALIQSSIFQERSKKSITGLSYYHEMGKTAFGILGDNSNDPTFQNMAEDFTHVADLCLEALGSNGTLTNEDALKQLAKKVSGAKQKSSHTTAVTIGKHLH